jgi:H+-translocating NAD(P) transhydrogenase subunit alpha
MIFGYISDISQQDNRISITPEIVKKLQADNIQVFINKDYGRHSNINDQKFIEAGAKVEEIKKIYSVSDVLVQISFEDNNVVQSLKNESTLIVNHFDKNKKDLFSSLTKKKINIFSLDLLPRITRAQSMDILSSQANLAGYKAVIDSVYEFNRAVPMMMTAAGTVSPAKFFVIGAGVAGLQAIATAKRLGGVVSATDVRAASKEQVESLGGRFVFVQNSENLETAGGYAKEASEDFKKKQEELIKKTIKDQDIVICTALIPGKKAPRIISEEMVLSMKPGSIICDLAAFQGGNSAFSEADKIIEKNGIKIIGYSNFASRISETASALLAKNIYNFVQLIYDKESKLIKINMEDEIIKNTYIGDIN